MARNFPENAIIHIWRYDFVIASKFIFISNESHQLIVNMRSGRIKEAATGRQRMKEEQLMIFTLKSAFNNN